MAALHELSAFDLRALIEAGEVSCREAADAHLARIEALDPELRAFITPTPETARGQADAWDRARALGARLPSDNPELPDWWNRSIHL